MRPTCCSCQASRRPAVQRDILATFRAHGVNTYTWAIDASRRLNTRLPVLQENVTARSQGGCVSTSS